MKLGKKKKQEPTVQDDFLTQEAKQEQATAAEYTLDIPEDEIWTYQIEGLQAPHVNQPFKNAKRNKIIVVIVLLIAISASIFLSVWAVHHDEYEYKDLGDGTYELVKYTNPGDVNSVTIDYVVDLETGEKDTSKPISVINEYAFNGDEYLNDITFGKDVKSIDGKSIYSCWWVQNVWIDDDNPYYCDIDGVVYNKDVTEVIFYPNDHDNYLRVQFGYAYIDDDGVQHSNLVDDDGNEMWELWGTTEKYGDDYYAKYNQEIRTYVIPSTVTKIGQLAFAYSNITDLYIPEGVTYIDNQAIFKNTILTGIYSYTTDTVITDPSYKSIDLFTSQYNSLPEGLEFIGSDAFYCDASLSYMYIPSSVQHIGHHAFWGTVNKGDDGNLTGIAQINVSLDEETFDANCDTGDQWRGKYYKGLFERNVDTVYSAQRE